MHIAITYYGTGDGRTGGRTAAQFCCSKTEIADSTGDFAGWRTRDSSKARCSAYKLKRNAVAPRRLYQNSGSGFQARSTKLGIDGVGAADLPYMLALDHWDAALRLGVDLRSGQSARPSHHSIQLITMTGADGLARGLP